MLSHRLPLKWIPCEEHLVERSVSVVLSWEDIYREPVSVGDRAVGDRAVGSSPSWVALLRRACIGR